MLHQANQGMRGWNFSGALDWSVCVLPLHALYCIYGPTIDSSNFTFTQHFLSSYTQSSQSAAPFFLPT